MRCGGVVDKNDVNVDADGIDVLYVCIVCIVVCEFVLVRVQIGIGQKKKKQKRGSTCNVASVERG